jgi:hypothetical protein
MMPDDVPGVLALNTLKGLDAEFDYGAGKFNLFHVENCAGGDVVYWTQGPAAAWPFKVGSAWGGSYWGEGVPHEILVSASLDGKDFNQAIIDTGRPVSAMRLTRARQAFGRSAIDADLQPAAAPQLPWPNDTDVHFFRHSFQLLSLEGVGIKSPDILLVDPFDPDIDFLIGNNVLKNFHLYFSYNQKVIYATAANAR